jgi:hypothetical protein
VGVSQLLVLDFEVQEQALENGVYLTLEKAGYLLSKCSQR